MTRLHRDEAGQVLIWVLLTITVLGLIMPPALGLATSAALRSRTLAAAARDREATEAGVEVGLELVRRGTVGTTAATAAIPNVSDTSSAVAVSAVRRPATSLAVTALTTATGPNCPAELQASLDGIPFPYGVTWSVTGLGAAGSIDQAGELRAPAGTYTVTATLANVSAALTVRVPSGTACP